MNKDVGVQGSVEPIFKRIYVMGMALFDLRQPPLHFLLSAFHLFCFTLIDVSVFSILPNIKTSFFLTDIIIQLGSRTPTGSLTERDEDEKSSPRASRSTVGEIKRITLAFWSGRRRLFVKFQMFDELYARIVTLKRLGGLEVVGLWLNPAADQGIAIFYRTLMHIGLGCVNHWSGIGAVGNRS